ncbi:Hsp70 family protein, partial [Methylobacterium sp. BTF04]|uniref:Hsp70 family protein n=1 Tax=Methylobacterium sp. BTF04 TaxID=2708300 RepID=UPI0013D09D03
DANGIVNVSAKDKASGKEQTIRIEASGGLDEAAIQRLVREAETHAGSDKVRKELVEAGNHADVAIYTTEKSLKEAEGQVAADVKAEVEKAVTAAKEAIQAGDLSRIKTATEHLNQVASRLGERGPAAKGPSADPEIVDAEFEDAPGDDTRHRPAA